MLENKYIRWALIGVIGLVTFAGIFAAGVRVGTHMNGGGFVQMKVKSGEYAPGGMKWDDSKDKYEKDDDDQGEDEQESYEKKKEYYSRSDQFGHGPQMGRNGHGFGGSHMSGMGRGNQSHGYRGHAIGGFFVTIVHLIVLAGLATLAVRYFYPAQFARIQANMKKRSEETKE